VVAPAEAGGEVSPEAVYTTWSYGSLEWSHRRQISLEAHAEQIRAKASLENVKSFARKFAELKTAAACFTNLSSPRDFSRTIGWAW